MLGGCNWLHISYAVALPGGKHNLLMQNVQNEWASIDKHFTSIKAWSFAEAQLFSSTTPWVNLSCEELDS